MAIGAWLYVLVPSLGPAYRFPHLAAVRAALPHTQALQAAAVANYSAVLLVHAAAHAAVR